MEGVSYTNPGQVLETPLTETRHIKMKLCRISSERAI